MRIREVPEACGLPKLIARTAPIRLVVHHDFRDKERKFSAVPVGYGVIPLTPILVTASFPLGGGLAAKQRLTRVRGGYVLLAFIRSMVLANYPVFTWDGTGYDVRAEGHTWSIPEL